METGRSGLRRASPTDHREVPGSHAVAGDPGEAVRPRDLGVESMEPGAGAADRLTVGCRKGGETDG